MSAIDRTVLVLYFTLVIGLGFWYQRRAARNLDSYFLGGKKLHWLALAMSGSVSNFDITGTMWIVSMLYLMGMKSMWIHWMWGCMMAAFCLAYMGKWVRRSGVMTGAEWMTTRFGIGRAGVVARTTYALMAVATLASFIGYAFQGVGKFVSVYVDLDPDVCALTIIGTTTLYVLLGGLYSVVVTDVIQTVILTGVAIAIAGIAYSHLDPRLLSESLPTDWASLAPRWRLSEFAGTENAEYQLFGALVVVWVLKGILMNAGGPAQMYDFQRFLAARDSRDAAKIGASWSLFLVVRWAMAMGIVLLMLTGLTDVDDPEKVMPIVLKEHLPAGARGIVIAGFLAAFMSTFSSTVNSGASFIVRDLWQPFTRREPGERELVRAGYFATISLVVAGVIVGFQAQSIAGIWNWMMMELGAGVILPNVLRWYWWRMNGWGYAAGTISGMVLALAAPFVSGAPMYITFPVICLGSLVFCIGVTLLTRPVDEETLVRFYRTVRPFGLWRPVRTRPELAPETVVPPAEKATRAIFNTALGIVAITGYYLAPMFLVGHWHVRALVWFGVAVLASTLLAKTWYPYLPGRGRGEGEAEGEPVAVERVTARGDGVGVTDDGVSPCRGATPELA